METLRSIKIQNQEEQTVTYPSSDKIMTAQEAVKLGLSQAQWMHQQKLNAQIRMQQSQNSQAARNEALVAAAVRGATNASNQIAASVARVPRAGDVYRWRSGDKAPWKIIGEFDQQWEIVCQSGQYTGVKQYYSKNQLIDCLKKEWCDLVSDENQNYVIPIDLSQPEKPMPFKRHPNCEEKAVHMTAHMCLGCEKLIMETTLEKTCLMGKMIHPENCECSRCATRGGRNRTGNIPSGVISGYGGIVGGSWNGRVP
jgi:hypothetical protein